MRKLRIINEVKYLERDISYRVFENRRGAAVAYGMEMEYERDGDIFRNVLFDIADDKDYVLKMNSVFAENRVLPEAFEEAAESYVCSVRL